jgi:hypothetical protein
MVYSLEILKDHFEKNAGETGIKIFQTSVSNLKIGEKPSNEQLIKLFIEVEKKLKLYFGNIKAKEILDKLEQGASESQVNLESVLQPHLETIFKTKGLPGESYLREVVRNVVSKGYKGDENKAIEVLKQLSKKKVIYALNYSMTRYEIQCFIERYPSYTQEDLENFLNSLMNKKLESNPDTIRALIEKERLYRKFEEQTSEDIFQEKISEQYTGLFKITGNNDYKFLMADDDLKNLLLKKISNVAFAKLYVI